MNDVRTCGTTRLGLPPAAAALAIGIALMMVAAFAPLPPLWVLVIYGAAMAAGAVALIISARQRRSEQAGGPR